MPSLRKNKNRKALLISVGFYLLMNILIYFLNPYSSRWHYQDHNPKAIAIESLMDRSFSVPQIEEILADIDLAYGARDPDKFELFKVTLGKAIQLIFLPATFALGVKTFMGYLGPANSAQQKFTLSVKQYYNQLVKIGASQGMQKKGFLFEVEPSLSKKNGPSY